MKVFVLVLAFLATTLASVEVQDPTLAVLEEIETLGVPPSAAIEDGYRYKTVRRFRARHRREVGELSSEYLPPTQELAYEAPTSEYLAPAPVIEVASGALADDGYRYKTVRRFRARHRRNVNELASGEYLPPIQGPSNDYLPPIGQFSASGALGDDGYRYRTVRRYRLRRRRRDVGELSSEYLPPTQELAIEAPSVEYLEPEVSSGALGIDGYRYKTVRRLRLRHRRDVDEIPADYLPPIAATAPAVADIPVIDSEYLAPIEQNENILADDGYRYKTVRRFKVRRH